MGEVELVAVAPQGIEAGPVYVCIRGEDVILERQAVKRLLEPSEVADVCAFLLGPTGRAFTGAPVVIDLGWTAR